MADQYKPTLVELETRVDQLQRGQCEVLQEALSRAARGEFKAITVVGVYPDGSVYTHVAGSDCAPALLGALTIAQRRVMDDLR
jgi:hypothetical protein